MSHEIEAKIKVAALEPIADKLEQLGADCGSGPDGGSDQGEG